jgi:hypothetical protein
MDVSSIASYVGELGQRFALFSPAKSLAVGKSAGHASKVDMIDTINNNYLYIPTFPTLSGITE